MIAALLLAVQAATPPAAAGTDVVVVARRQRCAVALRGSDLSGRQLAALERRWAAGEEVRVHAAPDARTRCLAKLMFRLADRGVTRATFVDDAPADPAER